MTWDLAEILKSRDRAERLAGADWIEEVLGDAPLAHAVRWAAVWNRWPGCVEDDGGNSHGKGWRWAGRPSANLLPYEIGEACNSHLFPSISGRYRENWTPFHCYRRLALALAERLAAGDPEARIDPAALMEYSK